MIQPNVEGDTGTKSSLLGVTSSIALLNAKAICQSLKHQPRHPVNGFLCSSSSVSGSKSTHENNLGLIFIQVPVLVLTPDIMYSLALILIILARTNKFYWVLLGLDKLFDISSQSWCILSTKLPRSCCFQKKDLNSFQQTINWSPPNLIS